MLYYISMECAKLLAALLAASLAIPAAADAPKVAASIAPIHSLVATVMAGVGAPVLIVDPQQSEHTFQLKPSQARALTESRLIVWVGPEDEPMLVRTIAALPKQARVITLTKLEGLALLPRRGGEGWEQDQDHGHRGAAGRVDPHIWLDPDMARSIVTAIRDALIALDPPNSDRYLSNARTADTTMRDLDGELRAALTPLKGRRFLVFHDAYQYFERRYGLAAAGAIALSPELAPGARHIADLRARIRAGGIVCVFTEPQFSPALVETVTQGLAVHTAVLDGIGAAYAPGPALWFDMMRGLARSFAGCLR
jgi:zinc transport system substrate-binding protein